MALAVVLVCVSVPAAAGENPRQGVSLAEARRALEEQLVSRVHGGFVGIGHSEETGEILVLVENEEAKAIAPEDFEGHPVRVEVSGRVYAYPSEVAGPGSTGSEERTGVVRPFLGGISVSAYVDEVSWYGTLGMVTYDGKILSNAHVIAMRPDTLDFLSIGTPIIQPGSYDGGTVDNRIGELEAYVPIEFGQGGTNYVDAAIGSIDAWADASPGEQFDEAGNHQIEGWTEVAVGHTVRKSGRTTGVTTGVVDDTNFTIDVWFDWHTYATFVDQIRVPQSVVNGSWSFADGGDSGSAVDKDGEFVGLVFAMSEHPEDPTTGYVFINKAEHIIDALGIQVFASGAEGLVGDSSTGWPLHGASVKVHETGQVAYTDSGGYYQILLPPGTYTLTASYPMFYDKTYNVQVAQGEFTTRNFALDPMYPGFPIPEDDAESIEQAKI